MNSDGFANGDDIVFKDVPKTPPGIEGLDVRYDPENFTVSFVVRFPKNTDFFKSLNDTNMLDVVKELKKKVFPPGWY